MMKVKAEGPKVKERLAAQKSVNVLEQLQRVFKVWIILVLKDIATISTHVKF
jgi:hypothetical protein